MLILGLCCSLVEAASIGRFDWQQAEGRDPYRLVFKVHENNDWTLDSFPTEWMYLKPMTKALFQTSPQTLAKTYQRLQAQGVEDLSTYMVINGEPEQLDAIAQRLQFDSRIEHLYRDFLPQPPPSDIPPTTPSFDERQYDRLSAPTGFGFDAVQSISQGEGVRIVDIEYSYDPFHEDLRNSQSEHTWGWDVDQWQYHGNAVLGQLIGTENAYGVTGYVPQSEVWVVSPYVNPDWYSVGDALLYTLDVLVEGDVVLIEQQTYAWGDYCPMEYVPAVFDAIQWVTASGIHVVEPSANGAHDLDDAQWDGWFDLYQQDSGAIMVGGSGANRLPLQWSGGSSFGSRIDVQGWFEGIVTTSTWELADLFYPEDSRQAYTQYFGGTSGASPQIVGVVATFQSALLASEGEVWSPLMMRQLLREQGRSQLYTDLDTVIGTQPNVETLVNMWAW